MYLWLKAELVFVTRCRPLHERYHIGQGDEIEGTQVRRQNSITDRTWRDGIEFSLRLPFALYDPTFRCDRGGAYALPFQVRGRDSGPTHHPTLCEHADICDGLLCIACACTALDFHPVDQASRPLQSFRSS